MFVVYVTATNTYTHTHTHTHTYRKRERERERNRRTDGRRDGRTDKHGIHTALVLYLADNCADTSHGHGMMYLTIRI